MTCDSCDGELYDDYIYEHRYLGTVCEGCFDTFLEELKGEAKRENRYWEYNEDEYRERLWEE